jgi:crotonobetainyl-CoA:carnitine CoA-transferase CaiB-like acyl-CoA transferase
MSHPGPLAGMRAIDMSTVVAGPAAAKYLADFGADVIKVEAPQGDPTRRMGWGPDEGDSYFWSILGRNKRCVTLDLKTPEGRNRMLALIDEAHVLIENFRPGTLERLGLSPAELLERNRRLVVLRVTGFGQSGPYALRPGFATLAESFSGYAALSGEPDGKPLLPPIAITDEVAGIVGAFAVLAAVRHADQTGEGQVIDVNLLETLFQLMGPLPAAYAATGYQQPRLGSGLPWTVPRGTYQCSDGTWVSLSATAETVAQRLLELIGVGDEDRFRTSQDRMENREELEALVEAWIAQRTYDEVESAFGAADAALARVYTMEDIFADAHFADREAIVEIDGVAMQNVVARMSRTPGRIRHAGLPQSFNQESLNSVSGWPPLDDVDDSEPDLGSDP